MPILAGFTHSVHISVVNTVPLLHRQLAIQLLGYSPCSYLKTVSSSPGSRLHTLIQYIKRSVFMVRVSSWQFPPRNTYYLNMVTVYGHIVTTAVQVHDLSTHVQWILQQ